MQLNQHRLATTTTTLIELIEDNIDRVQSNKNVALLHVSGSVPHHHRFSNVLVTFQQRFRKIHKSK